MTSSDRKKLAANKKCEKIQQNNKMKKIPTSSKPVNNLLSRDISC